MDAFIDLFDPLPIAVLFTIFIAAGLVFIFGHLELVVALEHPFSGSIAVSDQPLRVGVLAPTGR